MNKIYEYKITTSVEEFKKNEGVILRYNNLAGENNFKNDGDTA